MMQASHISRLSGDLDFPWDMRKKIKLNEIIPIHAEVKSEKITKQTLKSKINMFKKNKLLTLKFFAMTE